MTTPAPADVWFDEQPEELSTNGIVGTCNICKRAPGFHCRAHFVARIRALEEAIDEIAKAHHVVSVAQPMHDAVWKAREVLANGRLGLPSSNTQSEKK